MRGFKNSRSSNHLYVSEALGQLSASRIRLYWMMAFDKKTVIINGFQEKSDKCQVWDLLNHATKLSLN